MAARKKTARKRRSTRRTATKRATRRLRRTIQRADIGPNLRRLIQGGVFSASCARDLSPMTVNRIEDLSAIQVRTLIDVRRRVGRMPANCCLI